MACQSFISNPCLAACAQIQNQILGILTDLHIRGKLHGTLETKEQKTKKQNKINNIQNAFKCTQNCFYIRKTLLVVTCSARLVRIAVIKGLSSNDVTNNCLIVFLCYLAQEVQWWEHASLTQRFYFWDGALCWVVLRACQFFTLLWVGDSPSVAHFLSQYKPKYYSSES